MQRLENKVALVTGGSRGMGAAIVKRLAAEGAAVVLTYVSSAARAEQLVAEVKANGGQALSVAADNASPGAVVKAVELTVEKFGRIDILVNNAGIYVSRPLDETTVEDYDRTMNVNVRAVFLASQAAIRHMQHGARIITVGSNMADRITFPGGTLYGMSKSALTGFTKGLARELGERGITVNLVQPGPVDTDMNPANSAHAEMQRQGIALKHYGHVDDIASLVAFLASSEARYITGTAQTIDGGFNA